MASPFSLRSDMSYYTNLSSQSYPYYWSTRNSTSSAGGSTLFGSIDKSSQDDASGYEDAMLDLAKKVVSSDTTQKWILSIIGCLLVGLSGIFPLLFIPTTKSPTFGRSSAALSTENSTAVTKQETNIPAETIANGEVNKVIANGHHKPNGHHKANGACKTNGVCKSELIVPESVKSSGHDVNKTGISQKNLRRLLSFAVGSLLGDVFLHLLPEAWEHAQSYSTNDHDTMLKIGVCVLIGIISFLCCEMLITNVCGQEDDDEESSDSRNGIGNENDTSDPMHSSNNNHAKMNGYNAHGNHILKTEIPPPPSQPAQARNPKASHKQIAGYLNLVANCFDNFTHGLAVAGSFIVSPKIGIITTAAILLHEIPHEIGDFAILLRSGFNPWSAAKAQLSTAIVGLLGAIFTLSCDSMIIGDFTWWILPFTSGCFIQIAMSSILPELLTEDNPVESCLHFIFLLFGIGLMGFVTFIGGV